MVCRNIRCNMNIFNKMKQEKIISSENYLEVDYDSWNENLSEQTFAIFQFLDIKLTPEMLMLKDIQSHFSGSSVPGYQSTYRGQGWDRDRWRGELSQGQVSYVQSKCGHLGTED